MKTIAVLFIACCITLTTLAQTDPRISITSITPSENTGQDYSPWLNDNTDSLVADVWGDNMKYIDVTLHLASKSLVSSLIFFDDAGTFTTNPAYIYALNGTERIFLGLFEGPTYKTFINLNLSYPVLADAIVIHKYNNNIPQKVKVFGLPYIAGTSSEPQNRLIFTAATPSENTGQNYNLWLNDNLDSTIDWGNANSFKYIDVTLRLQQRSKVKRLSFWDTEGEFSSNPAYFYAVKDTQKIFLGTFTGPTYNTWVDLVLPEAIAADSIIVHKYSRYIPQKINAYGQPLLIDPLDTVVPSDGRIKITAVVPTENTGQDYSPWLNDNLDSLVQGNWTAANYVYTDVTLTLEKKSKIGRLVFYNTDVFYDHPALVYAKNDSVKTLIGEFIGNRYKSFIEMIPADSLIADAIVIHKYSNNLPHKIKVYGATYIPPPIIIENPDSLNIVKIPIDPKRWIQLNNTSNGLETLFDGVTDQWVETGWGKIFNNYDAYYPVNPGEEINLSSIKFYDGQSSSEDQPFTLSAITSTGQRIPLATFTGSRYGAWVGPYPNKEAEGDALFKLDSMVKNIRYLVINCSWLFPSEIEFYGSYKGGLPINPIVKKVSPLKGYFGVNAFEWDFLNAYNPMIIDESKYSAIKSFSGVRHYIDWEKLESQEGSYTFSPVHSGGWNYDTIYQRCKADGIEVLACIKTIPLWMQQTYPENEREWESVPVRYGSDFSNPASYIEQAKLGFQYASRYGYNTNVDRSLLSVNSTKRWTGDDTNSVKVGLGVIKYMECDNERDKWWKGRKGYQTAFEYAANLSAFYDGNKNTMGSGVGVKNADSSMKVVMAGLAAANASYVRGMIEWCRTHRGYRADGSVDICWDVINYHLYSNDSKASQVGIATRGVAPELSEAGQVAKDFIDLSHEYANDIPVWITEVGYDANQGSPYKAIPIGSKNEYQTQADWILRSSLLYARAGIEKVFFYQLYDDNFLNPIQFGSSGLINQERTRKPATDFLYQTNNLLGAYSYKETLNADPIVDRYELDGNSAYALVVPDEVGRTAPYQLNLNGIDSVKICSPLIGSDTMSTHYVRTNNGMLDITVTETPVFVIPLTRSESNLISATGPAPKSISLPISQLRTTTPKHSLKVYPNPTFGTVKVIIEADNDSDTEINFIEVATGRVLKRIPVGKGKGLVSKEIDMTAYSSGMYKLQVKQGNLIEYKSVLKIED